MRVRFAYKTIFGLVACSTALLLVLFFTQPSETNVALSFAPLLFFWGVIYFLCGLVAKLVFRQARAGIVQVVRIALASSITLMIMFGALGEVSVLDMVVLFALATLGSFYFSRTWQ